MPTYTAVDYDPFAQEQQPNVKLTPVDGDPFAPSAPPVSKNQKLAEDYVASHPNSQLANYATKYLHGATLGLGDRLVAGTHALYRQATENDPNTSFWDRIRQEKALQDARYKEATDKTGMAGTAAELVAGMGPVGGIGKAVEAASMSRAAQALPGVGSIAAGVARSPWQQAALTGGAAGGIEAAAEDQNVGGGIFGGALGGIAGNAVGQGLSKMTQMMGKTAAPRFADAEALVDAKKAAYDTFENSDALFTGAGLKQLRDNMHMALANEAYSARKAPKVANMLRDIEQNIKGGFTLNSQGPAPFVTTPKGMQAIRQSAQDAANSADAQESRLGKIMLGHIDGFMSNARPGVDVMGADAATVGPRLAEANALNTAASKVGLLDKEIENAAMQAAVTGSGGNVENTSRQAMKRIKSKRSWSPDEADAIQEAITGGRGRLSGENMLRLLGKLSPEGNGLTMMLHLLGGAVGAGGYSVPAAIAGFGAKRAAEGMQRARVRGARDIILNMGQKPAFTPVRAQKYVDAARPYLTDAGISGLLGIY